jgi:hypothetical protein
VDDVFQYPDASIAVARQAWIKTCQDRLAAWAAKNRS